MPNSGGHLEEFSHEQSLPATDIQPRLGRAGVGISLDMFPGSNPLFGTVASKTGETAEAWSIDSYSKLPLTFEANHGQTDGRVKFLSRVGEYTLYLLTSEAVLTLPIRTQATSENNQRDTPAGALTVVRMQLVGANPVPQVMGQNKLPGKSNYFIGSDPQDWRTDVPNYAKVEYQDVYPGIPPYLLRQPAAA